MSKKYDAKLDKGVRKFAVMSGADMVGVCSPDSLYSLPDHESRIREMVKDPKAILVTAIRMFPGPINCSDKNVRPAQYETYCLYGQLDKIAFDVSRYLDDLGYEAVAIPTFLPVEMSVAKRGLIGDVSLRHAAEEAGLGRIGLNRLLLTEKFGPRVRIAGVVTDAPLKIDSKIDKDICNKCGECIRACPTGAISEDGKVEMKKCSPHMLKYGLPGLINVARKYLGKGEKEIVDMTRDPAYWELWQTSMLGTFYYCFNCIRACPIGRKAQRQGT